VRLHPGPECGTARRDLQLRPVGQQTTINTESSLPARLKDIANRLADDHQRMMTRYQISYAGDSKVMQPTVNVASSRDGVQLQMSVRRPF
jgi:hypothetical protein